MGFLQRLQAYQGCWQLTFQFDADRCDRRKWFVPPCSNEIQSNLNHLTYLNLTEPSSLYSLYLISLKNYITVIALKINLINRFNFCTYDNFYDQFFPWCDCFTKTCVFLYSRNYHFKCIHPKIFIKLFFIFY